MTKRGIGHIISKKYNSTNGYEEDEVIGALMLREQMEMLKPLP
ncbi:hypothetical protein B2K_38405 [Paenibacillus mucilaginosus K02]|uniref:Uncharacterized protein n=1 Tax=Paenibacillus mucilaginosus K02 TaxID=997761 RepID=R9UL49_9BACL|nr:hypothetical protein B2K_38405 [Paenibacillus mucilaginosus K02]